MTELLDHLLQSEDSSVFSAGLLFCDWLKVVENFLCNGILADRCLKVQSCENLFLLQKDKD